MKCDQAFSLCYSALVGRSTINSSCKCSTENDALLVLNWKCFINVLWRYAMKRRCLSTDTLEKLSTHSAYQANMPHSASWSAVGESQVDTCGATKRWKKKHQAKLGYPYGCFSFYYYYCFFVVVPEVLNPTWAKTKTLIRVRFWRWSKTIAKNNCVESLHGNSWSLA